jgi:hypothetical protein
VALQTDWIIAGLIHDSTPFGRLHPKLSGLYNIDLLNHGYEDNATGFPQG